MGQNQNLLAEQVGPEDNISAAFNTVGFGLASSYSSIDVSRGQTDFVSDLINFTPAEAFVGSGC